MYKFRVFFGSSQDNVYTDIELPAIPDKDDIIMLHEEELRQLHYKITKKSEFLADWLEDYGKMSQKEFIDFTGKQLGFFQVANMFYVSNDEKIRIVFRERPTVRYAMNKMKEDEERKNKDLQDFDKSLKERMNKK